MFRPIHHGHSLALGCLLTLLVERNGAWVFITLTLTFLAGVFAGRAWSFWSDAARALRARATRTPRRPLRKPDLFTVPRSRR